MLTMHDTILLHHLKKIGKARNLLHVSIEPFDGVTGSVFIETGVDTVTKLTGKDYFSFMSLLDQGYLVLSQPQDSLYQFSYKAVQYVERCITDFLALFFTRFFAPVAVAVISALIIAA